jgi:hypothetical protein
MWELLFWEGLPTLLSQAFEDEQLRMPEQAKMPATQISVPIPSDNSACRSFSTLVLLTTSGLMCFY